MLYAFIKDIKIFSSSENAGGILLSRADDVVKHSLAPNQQKLPNIIQEIQSVSFNYIFLSFLNWEFLKSVIPLLLYSVGLSVLSAFFWNDGLLLAFFPEIKRSLFVRLTFSIMAILFLSSANDIFIIPKIENIVLNSYESVADKLFDNIADEILYEMEIEEIQKIFSVISKNFSSLAHHIFLGPFIKIISLLFYYLISKSIVKYSGKDWRLECFPDVSQVKIIRLLFSSFIFNEDTLQRANATNEEKAIIKTSEMFLLQLCFILLTSQIIFYTTFFFIEKQGKKESFQENIKNTILNFDSILASDIEKSNKKILIESEEIDKKNHIFNRFDGYALVFKILILSFLFFLLFLFLTNKSSRKALSSYLLSCFMNFYLLSLTSEMFSIWGWLIENFANIRPAVKALNYIKINKNIINRKDIYGQIKKIEFKNTSLGYNFNKILSNINVNFSTGEIFLISGESGGGKTTLIRSILNYISPLGGSLSFYVENEQNKILEKVDVSEIKRMCLLKKIGYCSQFFYMLDKNIKDFLLDFNPEATMKMLSEVLDIVGLDEWVMSRPEQLQSRIGENGMALSGGQRSRLQFAGIILSKMDSKMNLKGYVIADETLDNVDKENRTNIMEKLETRIKKGEFVLIIISHLKDICEGRNYTSLVVKDGTISISNATEAA